MKYLAALILFCVSIHVSADVLKGYLRKDPAGWRLKPLSKSLATPSEPFCDHPLLKRYEGAYVEIVYTNAPKAKCLPVQDAGMGILDPIGDGELKKK